MEQSTRKLIKQFIIRLRFITQTRLTRIQKETNATTKIIELSQAETENDTAKQRGVQQTEQNKTKQIIAKEENVTEVQQRERR